MTSNQATAEVFLTAFRSLKKKEQAAILQNLLRDEETREDMRYAIAIEERKEEPKISLDEYLERRKKQGV